jgi:hypothetical protein
MESLAEQCCTRGHNGTGRVVVPDGNKDLVEEGMCVPVSVLDGCGQLFIAADEMREKASTQFFTDTGLMALLCRHDRVLWLVNLTSAGEKQHYALALLKQFITHIPNDMRVGFLYDIGCQIECSWHKWKFFDDSILSRFQFGVSVFHAYGHQWPCQIIYHPRKHEGFGLSDGEGCKRLWSALKPLISPLRVSGVSLLCLNYNSRLELFSTINDSLCSTCKCDTSIQNLSQDLHCGCLVGGPAVMLGSGVWTVDCEIVDVMWGNFVLNGWLRLSIRQGLHQVCALHSLVLSGDSMAMANAGQSKNKVDKEIGMILELEQLVKACAATISALKMHFVANRITDFASFGLNIADARAQYDKLSDMLLQRCAALGVSATAQLRQLCHSKYLQVRVNALAVKTWIRDQLRGRKFELERMENAYRQSAGGAGLLHFI